MDEDAIGFRSTGDGFKGRYPFQLLPFRSSFVGSVISRNIGACASSAAMFSPGDVWVGSRVSGFGKTSVFVSETEELSSSRSGESSSLLVEGSFSFGLD